jgi:transcriptional regulator
MFVHRARQRGIRVKRRFHISNAVEARELVRMFGGAAFHSPHGAGHAAANEVILRPLDEKGIFLKTQLFVRSDNTSTLVDEPVRSFIRGRRMTASISPICPIPQMAPSVPPDDVMVTAPRCEQFADLEYVWTDGRLSGVILACLTTAHELSLTVDRWARNPVVDYRGDGMPTSTELLQGTLDLLILQTLATGSMHGWGVAQRIQQVSKDVLQIGQGSLYPALHRLEYKGWIRSDWGNSENNRRAKFYSLTRAGRKQLETELEDWDRLSAAVTLVLGRIPEASS